DMVNSTVSGMMPQTLNATQKSVEKPRQTTSFSTASSRKNTPQRRVSLRQPSSSRLKALSNTYPSSDRPKNRPPSSTPPNSVLMMVGFILMKVSSCSQSVSAPKTKTTTPET